MEDVRQFLSRLRNGEAAKKEVDAIETSVLEDQAQQSAHSTEMFDRRYLKRTLLSIFRLICMQTTEVPLPPFDALDFNFVLLICIRSTEY